LDVVTKLFRETPPVHQYQIFVQEMYLSAIEDQVLMQYARLNTTAPYIRARIGNVKELIQV
jgi:hypothetical protein